MSVCGPLHDLRSYLYTYTRLENATTVQQKHFMHFKNILRSANIPDCRIKDVLTEKHCKHVIICVGPSARLHYSDSMQLILRFPLCKDNMVVDMNCNNF